MGGDLAFRSLVRRALKKAGSAACLANGAGRFRTGAATAIASYGNAVLGLSVSGCDSVDVDHARRGQVDEPTEREMHRAAEPTPPKRLSKRWRRQADPHGL
jgi:hypothetical protein